MMIRVMTGKNTALLVVFALIVLNSCSSQKTESPQASRFKLRVSLFPWVPDGESLIKWIEADFESKNPDVDLVVRPLKKSDESQPDYAGDLAYEIDKTVSALTTDGSDSQDLVEIDTMTLGELVKRQAVVTFGLKEPSFLPVAAEAVTLQGITYGVPHWTCGYFAISEHEAVRSAVNLPELLAKLKLLGTERVDLVGDLDGSWDSIMVYLDAFQDTYPNGNMFDALSVSVLDPVVSASFRTISASCSLKGKNFCGDDGVDLFTQEGADALIGYSERLNPILRHTKSKGKKFHIASATLGSGDQPTLFTDALVLAPRCATGQCLEAAKKFASYYVSDKVFETLLLSLDLGSSATPRYLLPSTTSAFEFGRVANDRLYAELKAEINGARPFPNLGVPEAREKGLIRQKVKEALGLN